MSVSKRIEKIGVSPTMKVAAKAKEMRAQGLDVIDLSVGEPDFPTPQNIKDAAKKAIDNNFTTYTVNAGIPKLREVIKDKLKKDNNLDYETGNIIVSSGAKHSLFNTIQSIVYVDDEVIIPAPYWVSYPHMVSLADGKSVIIPTTEETGFKITPKQLENVITSNTKVFILCNPSNPTGSAYSKSELQQLAEVLEGSNIYIIADEIYEKLVYDNFEFISFASLSDTIKERTVTINGISKAYSMTGWRLGFAAGPEDVIKGINKIQSHSTSNASSISQHAAIEALSGPQDAVEEMRKEFEERRNFLCDALNLINGVTCHKPEGAFYLFPNVSGLLNTTNGENKIKNSFDLSMYLLNEALIAAVPGSSFGAEGYIRISYANSMENLEKAVERLKSVLAKLS